MQPFTLNQAAKACHKSKSAILEAIRAGRLSAGRDDKNQWQIDPAELFRVYPTRTSTEPLYQVDHYQPEPTPTPSDNHPTTAMMLDKIASIEVERERERKQLQNTIDDLRRRLDQESEERRKLTMLLTHQPEKQQDIKQDRKEDSPLWRKLFGRY
jgi:hypothetical protein